MGLLTDFLQGASNSAASNISAPVDGIAWLLRKAGIDTGTPVMGSDWMAQKGFTAQPQNRNAGLLGEAIGGVAPLLAAAKAPQIAKGLLSLDDKAMDMGRQAIESRMVNSGMLQPATVWHGSPHKFDKFDSSKIGTGEGAQAYGHGLYLAESPDVANAYKAAQRDQSSGAIADKYLKNWGSKDKAISALEQRLPKVREEFKPEFVSQYEEALSMLKRGESGGGSLYKVDLPDEHIAKMLDWDKPLSQQPANIQSWLKDAYNPYRKQLTALDVGGNEPTGGLVMNRLQQLMSEGKKADVFTNAANYGAANASREIADYGIPGIRYLDGGSRGTGAGTSNFVVFPGNEGLLQILERNGQALK